MGPGRGTGVPSIPEWTRGRTKRPVCGAECIGVGARGYRSVFGVADDVIPHSCSYLTRGWDLVWRVRKSV